MTQPLWKWELDPKVTSKRCPHCYKSLFSDRESLVTYKSSTYHLNCILDYLTSENEKRVISNSSGIDNLSLIDGYHAP